MSKAGALDARQHFTAAQVAEMEELLTINEKLKELDKRKKVLVESVKEAMVKAKATDVDLDGSSFAVTESMRRTVTAKTKNDFITQLLAQNKKHLIITTIEPDVDSIFAEVDAGLLQKDFVEQYVKVTPVLTLRCN